MVQYYKTVTTIVEAELAEKFKKLCAGKGCTVAKALREEIKRMIEQDDRRKDKSERRENSDRANKLESRDSETEEDPFK